MPNIPETKYYGRIKPPYTEQVSMLRSAPLLRRLKDVGNSCIGTFIVMLVPTAILAGIGVVEEDWAVATTTGIGFLAFLYLNYSFLRNRMALCPYCEGKLDTDKWLRKKDEHAVLQCDHCHEYLVNNRGRIRACHEADAEDGEMAFTAPALPDGRWPGECIVCGKPVDKWEEANTVKFEAAHLLLGSLSVSTGSVKNIPYCEDHTGVVAVKVTDGKVRMVFPSLSMQRRYLAVNKKWKI